MQALSIGAPATKVSLLPMKGDHLTPASAGLRQGLLGDWADDPSRARVIGNLIESIGNLGLGLERQR